MHATISNFRLLDSVQGTVSLNILETRLDSFDLELRFGTTRSSSGFSQSTISLFSLEVHWIATTLEALKVEPVTNEVDFANKTEQILQYAAASSDIQRQLLGILIAKVSYTAAGVRNDSHSNEDRS